MGGNICLGAEGDCRTTNSTRTLDVYAYVGLVPEAPMRSWFMVMINELTVRRILFLMEAHTSIGEQTSNLPEKLLETGFYPLKDPSQCPSGNDNRETVDTDCYVLMSYTSEQHEVPVGGGTLVVRPGLEVKGILDIAGWEVRVDLRVAPTLVSVDVEMDHLAVSFGGGSTPFLELGGHLEGGVAKGGARFLVQAGMVGGQPKAVVEIHGAVSIAVLDTYGAVEVSLTGDRFLFNTEITLFGGAWETRALAEWDWDLTYMRMDLGGVSFLWGSVTLGSVSCEYRNNPSTGVFELGFAAKISVFGFLGVDGSMTYKKQGVRRVVDFRLEVSAGLAVEVWGSAEVAVPFTESRFDVHVRVKLSEALQHIKDAVVKAVRDVGRELKRAWDSVAHKAAQFLQKGFDLLTQGWPDLSRAGSFGEAVGMLAESVFDHAVMVGKWLVDGVVDGVGWIVDGIKDLLTKTKKSKPYKTGQKNDWGCDIWKQKWKECVDSWLLDWICTSHSRTYPDRECMILKATRAREAKEAKDRSDELDGVVADSQGANRGMASIVDADEAAVSAAYHPTVNDVEKTVDFSHRGTVYATASMSGPKVGSGGGDLFGSEHETLEATVGINVNAFDGPRAHAKVVDTLKAHALRSQGLMTPDLRREGGDAITATPVLAFEDVEAAAPRVSCEAYSAGGVAKPVFMVLDRRCSSGARVALAESVATEECGTVTVRNTYVGYDSPGCGKRSEGLEQVVTVEPPSLAFTYFPPDCTMCAEDPLRKHGEPRVKGCGNEVRITHSDSPY
eukprot:Sspe_Gene.33620::Locus_16394_Transcript_1_1_Confidence_1.000_Length_2447::g.33620::m.33620